MASRNQELLQEVRHDAQRSDGHTTHDPRFPQGLHALSTAPTTAWMNPQGPSARSNFAGSPSHHQGFRQTRSSNFDFDDFPTYTPQSMAHAAAPTLQEHLLPLSLHEQFTGEYMRLQQPALHGNQPVAFLAPYYMYYPGTLPVLLSVPDNPQLALAFDTSYTTSSAPGMLSHPWANFMP